MKFKRDINILKVSVERKIGSRLLKPSDFERLSALFKKHQLHVNSAAVNKVWSYVKGAERPSKDTLDKLALFVGFQSWHDFQSALHGDSDAQANYENDDK